MMRFLPLAVATFALACHPAVDAPGVPLYPNSATTRLPRDQIAQINGPIIKIDGHDVRDKGGLFDVLPGCHLVELDRNANAGSYALASGAYWVGDFPITIYAIHMKAGARYVIRRDIYSDGMGMGRINLSAREEQANGATADLLPVQSAEEINACTR